MNILLLLLTVLVGGALSTCTQDEQTSVVTCFLVYANEFESHFGTNGTCDTSLITDTYCRYYAFSVNCVNGMPVSDLQCRPTLVDWINSISAIPCTLQDFQAGCPNAPKMSSGNTMIFRKCELLIEIIVSVCFIKLLTSAF